MDPPLRARPVIRYLGRRLLSMVPTLFGITIVTFILMHLPKGDPVAASMGEGSLRAGSAVSREAVEEYRRTHFLHLPLFFNQSPEDLPRQVDTMLGKLGGSRRDWTIRRMAIRGGVVFPIVLPRLGLLPSQQRSGVLEALGRIAERNGAAEELAAAPDPAAFWRSWWDLHRIDFRPANAARLVHRYARRGSPAVLAELRGLDTFAVPALLDAIDGEPGPRALERLSGVLSSVTEREVVFRVGESEARRRDTIEDWREWWFKRRSEYVQYRGAARLTAAFTETRYFKWAVRITSFSFGQSARDGRPIGDKMLERAPVTLLLSGLAVFFSYLLAIPLGVFSAVRRGHVADKVIAVLLFVAASMPTFWVGMNLIRTIGRRGWLPIRGLTSPGFEELSLSSQALDLVQHLAMPVFCLTYVSLASLSRYQRVAMLEVIRQDYIRTARAKGVGPIRLIVRHALRNALLPIVTLLGLQLPYLIGGSVIVEQLFSINGMGYETFEAILYRDYNWIMAVVTLSAVLTMAGVLVADVLYAIVDPRIGFGGRRGAGGRP